MGIRVPTHKNETGPNSATPLVDHGLGEAYEIVKQVHTDLFKIRSLVNIADKIELIADNLVTLENLVTTEDLVNYASAEHTHENLYQPLGNYAAANHNHNDIYAIIGHDHEDIYALTGHNHAGEYQPAGNYALASHNHNGVYAIASHNHDALYAPIGHNHTGVYALAGHTHENMLTEAPMTGTGYVRKNGAWVPEETGGSEGISDAPANSKVYGRSNNDWVEIETPGETSDGIEDAPTDGSLYGRKNAQWAAITGGGGGSSVVLDVAPGPFGTLASGGISHQTLWSLTIPAGTVGSTTDFIDIEFATLSSAVGTHTREFALAIHNSDGVLINRWAEPRGTTNHATIQQYRLFRTGPTTGMLQVCTSGGTNNSWPNGAVFGRHAGLSLVDIDWSSPLELRVTGRTSAVSTNNNEISAYGIVATLHKK